MFSRRVFGGTPDTFRITLEYGNSHSDYALNREQLGSSSPVNVRLPVALATLEFQFNSDEADSTVLERFTQRISTLVFSRIEERLVLTLSNDSIAHAASFPEPKLRVRLSVACSAPVIRNIQVSRLSSSGSVPESLLTSLLKHCDLRGVWKVKGADGFGNFWASCTEPSQWASLRTLNLSHCGLTTLPSGIGALQTLRILRASHNKLSALPADMQHLRDLEVLAVDHNLLNAVPVELRLCSALKEINLEGNKMTTLVLDLRALKNLQSLQLYGNPLDYLPELSPCTQLRSLSLANVRIMADAKYTRWEVEVSSTSYMSRSHKLAALFRLTFRRSSLQHPLLAGALGRISEDRASCELIAKEEVAVQQLVVLTMSEHPVVVREACRCILMLAALDPATAKNLVHHDVISAITSLTKSSSQESQLQGLNLLSSLAQCCEVVSAELLDESLLGQLYRLVLTGDPGVRQGALAALAELAFCRDNKAKVHQYPGLLSLVISLAQPHDPAGTSGSSRLLALRVLAVLGENEQVRLALRKPAIKGRGIRVLSMDGGGMKGLTMVVFLRHLERRVGRPIQELFDLIVGTSTGAVMATSLGVVNTSVEDCRTIYTNLGQKVFNKATAAPKEDLNAGWRDSLYRMYHSSSQNLRVAVYGYKHDAMPFEALLKDMCSVKKLGCWSEQFIDTISLGGPNVAVVSTLASVTPALPFVFRNFELPLGGELRAEKLCACSASSKHLMWQAVRASSAAPYYLDDFVCGDDRFQDGAVVANNPAILALQQARLLWPDIPVDCLVSLGSGQPPVAKRVRSLSTVEALSAMVESACSTERVDEAISTMAPMVPGLHYYRFQVTDERCGMELDDIDPASWAKLEAAAEAYCIRHAARFDEVGELLMEPLLRAGSADDSDVGAEAVAGGSPKPPSARLGSRRGLLLLESPRPSPLAPSATVTDAVAAGLAALPHLARRCDLGECLATRPERHDSSGDNDTATAATAAAAAADIEDHALIRASKFRAVESSEGGATGEKGDTVGSGAMGAGRVGRVPSNGSGTGGGGSAGSGGRSASAQSLETSASLSGLLQPTVSAPPSLLLSAAAAAGDRPPSSSADALTGQQGPPASPTSIMDFFFRTSWGQQQQQQQAPSSAPLAEHPTPSRVVVRALSSGGGAGSRTPPDDRRLSATGVAPPDTDGSLQLEPAPPSLHGPVVSLPAAALLHAATPGALTPPPAAPPLAAPTPLACGSSGRRPPHRTPSMMPHVSARGLLRGLLEDLGERIGIVHLALHAGGFEGLVAEWQTDVFSVVEPGAQADTLISELGGDPATVSLTALCEQHRSGFWSPDHTTHTVHLGLQQFTTRTGDTLVSHVFQRNTPKQLLGPDDVDAAGEEWAGLLVTSTALLSPQMIHALLRAGVVSVVAPAPAAAAAPLPAALLAAAAAEPPLTQRPHSSAGPSGTPASAAAAGWRPASLPHGASAADVGKLFVHLYEQLYAGQAVAAALRHAETQCPMLPHGLLVCYPSSA